MKKLILSTLAATAFGVATANVSAANSDTIRLAYPNWAEGIAMTNLAAAVLEDELNYDVELTQADPGTIYAALANGDQDVFLDAWLPNTHEPYWEKYKNDLEDLGPNFGYGVTGLAVPAYMDIDSIEQINDIADKIDHKIIGIGTGAGIYRNTNRAIDAYGLDVKQVASSGPAMTAALAGAIDKHEPIIVTGWKPHWMFGRYDLKVLKDPKGIFPIDACKTVARKGFRKEHPEVAQFLQNFTMPEPQLLDLMLAIDDSRDDPADVARDWMNDHRALVDSWIPRL